MFKGSRFSTSLPTFDICGILDDSCLTKVRWYLILFICVSLKINECWPSFICLLSIYMYLENIYSGLLPEFWIGWVFGYWFVWDVAVFWIFILCHLYMCKYFIHSIDCLLNLSAVFFYMKKLLSLIWSSLFIFAFTSFALGEI